MAAFAQASIAGVVRDTSGAVLPGVTVEAASPALIEKVRNVTTDGNGQYRIIDLRPGTYDVTFTLPGFTTVKREGLELSGSATVNANAEMRVGALEETVTVTGATPLVDTQNAVRQAVLSKEVVDAIPNGKYYSNLAVLVPGVTIAAANGSASGSTQDVGGSNGDSQSTLTVHGSRPVDQRFTINGVPFGEGNGSTHGMGPNVAAMQEVTINTGAVDASLGQGGVRINFVPREGGNQFSGGIGINGARESWQSTNLDDELLARGASEGNRLKRLYDVSPVFGGPIKRDKLWFFASWRRNQVDDYAAGQYWNKNLGDPNARTYARDTSRQIITENLFRYAGARITWQATQRNKIAVSYDWRDRCGCVQAAAISAVATTASLEANTNVVFKPMNITTVNWSAPLTSRLLMDAGLNYLQARQKFLPTEAFVPGGILKIEQAPLQGDPAGFGGRLFLSDRGFPSMNARFGTTYVTGTHSIAAGLQLNRSKSTLNDFATNPAAPFVYTMTRGVPTAIQINAYPQISDARTGADLGLYVQDKWTRGKLTLAGGVRFDYLYTYAAPVTLGPAPLLPTRNLSFPKTDMLRWKDLTPKASAIYDLFGNGRTALKASLNRYLQQQGPAGNASLNLQPVAFVQQSATRAWTDSNNNFYPDCDLLNGAAQNNTATGGDVCGAWTGASANYGRPVPATKVDPDTQFGWGRRPFNWESSIAVQHSLTSRVSAEVSYFRRWYGNFTVTDNLALAASDYSSFSVTAPVDARLPNGGGYTFAGFVNVNPDKASVPVDNFWTFAKDYGKQIEHWNGVDVSVNARIGPGIVFQGGTSTGRTSTDNCEILAKVPEGSIGTPAAATFTQIGAAGTAPYCHVDTKWLTQVKGLGSYVVPGIDVQVAGTFQSIPGPQIWSTLVVPTATVAQSLGRPLSGNAANVAVNIVEPGQMYGDRLNQFDLRFGKILRYRTTRTAVNLDLYNMFNGNAVTSENTNYSSFRVPTAIVAPRIIKVSVQLDF